MCNNYLAVGLTIFLAGCSLAPDYKTPEMQMPVGNQGICNLNFDEWWTVFNDSTLNELEKRALQENADVRKAFYRVKEAMASAGIDSSAMLPSINAQGTGAKVYQSERMIAPGVEREVNSFSVGMSFAYELDLFAKNINLSKAAFNEYLATDEARHAVYLTVTAAVATAYFSLVSAMEQLEIQKKTLVTREKTYRIYQSRFKNGYCKEVDLKRVEAEMHGVKADMLSAEINKSAAETMLAVLIGASPREIYEGLCIKTNGIKSFKPSDGIPHDLPSDLLLRRPDISSTEHSLIAANARIGAARAAFFPSISLTSFIGSDATSISDIFGSGSDKWSLSGGINLPIFQGGKVMFGTQIAKARYEQAVDSYKNTVRTAFKEAKNALVASAKTKDMVEVVDKQAEATARGYVLAQKQQASGLIGLTDLLDIERGLLSVQLKQVSTRCEMLKSLVDVCKSIGGGWKKNEKK